MLCVLLCGVTTPLPSFFHYIPKALLADWMPLDLQDWLCVFVDLCVSLCSAGTLDKNFPKGAGTASWTRCIAKILPWIHSGQIIKNQCAGSIRIFYDDMVRIHFDWFPICKARGKKTPFGEHGAGLRVKYNCKMNFLYLFWQQVVLDLWSECISLRESGPILQSLCLWSIDFYICFAARFSESLPLLSESHGR